MKKVSFYSMSRMKELTINAKLFSVHGEEKGKYENIVINMANLTIEGLGDEKILLTNIVLHQGEGPNYVQLELETTDELRAYVQYINNRKTMASELYDIISKSME